MQVTISANGKNIKAEISEEQAKILGLVEEKPKTGYESLGTGETYYLVNVDDEITTMKYNSRLDRDCYDVGNYYSDKVIAENNARADRLLRQLRQWQAANDKPITKKDWEDYSVTKYNIDYDYFTNRLLVSWTTRDRKLNNVYFTSEKIVKEAIELFKDELLWYFTEYTQRLDEAQNG